MLLVCSAPGDYSSGIFPVTFDSMTSTQCISITLVDDNLVEDTETFTVSLSSSDPAVQLGTPSTAFVSILDTSGVQCSKFTYCSP